MTSLPQVQGSRGSVEATPIIQLTQEGNFIDLRLLLGQGATFKAVPQLSTKVVLGSKGTKGDILSGVLIVPWRSQESGEVWVYDGDVGFRIYVGGGSVNSPVPFFCPMAVSSRKGPWSLTVGKNIDATAFGWFTDA